MEILNGYNTVALRFGTKEEFDKGIEVVFSGTGKIIPHWLVGDWTIIVPLQYVNLFKDLKFDRVEVISAAELDAEEIAELRRENLSFRDR